MLTVGAFPVRRNAPDTVVVAGFIAENAPRVQVGKSELGAALIAVM